MAAPAIRLLKTAMDVNARQNTQPVNTVDHPHPEVKWSSGKCNFATHIKDETPKTKRKSMH